jgi:hypothetical protein
MQQGTSAHPTDLIDFGLRSLEFIKEQFERAFENPKDQTGAVVAATGMIREISARLQSEDPQMHTMLMLVCEQWVVDNPRRREAWDVLAKAERNDFLTRVPAILAGIADLRSVLNCLKDGQSGLQT